MLTFLYPFTISLSFLGWILASTLPVTTEIINLFQKKKRIRQSTYNHLQIIGEKLAFHWITLFKFIGVYIILVSLSIYLYPFLAFLSLLPIFRKDEGDCLTLRIFLVFSSLITVFLQDFSLFFFIISCINILLGGQHFRRQLISFKETSKVLF